MDLRRTLLLSLAVLPAASCIGGAGSGGGGGAVGGGTGPLDPGGDFLPTAGLTSLVAGAGSLRVEWQASDPAGNPLPVAVFRATSSAAVYAGPPAAVQPPGTSLVWTGLTDDIDWYAGLAIDLGGGNFAPVGEVLRSHTRAPIYVDAASTAASPDGLTPATAFPDPLSGVLTALAAGGGNVWVAGGTYAGVSLPIGANVSVFGGFDPTLTLAARDATLFPTVLQGFPNGTIVAVQGGGPSTLDGLVLDGGGVASLGLDLDTSDLEARQLTIQGCTSRGISLRSLDLFQAYDAEFVRCFVQRNGNEGLSANGAWNLCLEASRFESNGQEGVDCCDLVGPDNVPVSLQARASRFAGNGAEGLDCDLVPPLFPGGGGSHFDIEVTDCVFELNVLDGLLVDFDFDLVNGWDADVLVQGIVARDNGGNGVRVDADSFGQVFLYRIAASANGGDGIQVSSETVAGVALVASSACTGNLGYGIRATFGNFPILVSHCVVAGNTLGGVASDTVTSTATSTAAWLQASPWNGTQTHFVAVGSDPLSPLFASAPEEFLRVVGVNPTTVALASLGGLQAGQVVELAGDDVARSITSFGNSSIAVAPGPAPTITPTSLSAFAPGSSTVEDWTPLPGTAAAGGGMAPPGGVAPDVGPAGAPHPAQPGLQPPGLPEPFRVADASPVSAVASTGRITIRFAGGPLSVASVGPGTVRVVDGTGADAGALIGTMSGQIELDPPPGGWPGPTVLVELFGGLAAADGRTLAAPLAIRYAVQ